MRAALRRHGAPIYVRHEIVHNQHVVDELRALGALFVDDLEDVPRGARVIFSAHGVAPDVWAQARSRGLDVIDATCPLVTKVHLEVAEHARAGRTVLVLGHRHHVEVQGTVGHAEGTTVHVIEDAEQAQALELPPGTPVAYVTQTTLSVDDTARTLALLRRRLPQLVGPHKDDICYATQNRQRAVAELARRCDVVVVVGAPHSSNTVRMVEVARAAGAAAYRVDTAGELQRAWFDGSVERIGLSSGASVPEHLFEEVQARLRAWWPGLVERGVGEAETIRFRPPRGLDT